MLLNQGFSITGSWNFFFLFTVQQISINQSMILNLKSENIN